VTVLIETKRLQRIRSPFGEVIAIVVPGQTRAGKATQPIGRPETRQRERPSEWHAADAIPPKTVFEDGVPVSRRNVGQQQRCSDLAGDSRDIGQARAICDWDGARRQTEIQ
jgi:hypothetical protein